MSANVAITPECEAPRQAPESIPAIAMTEIEWRDATPPGDPENSRLHAAIEIAGALMALTAVAVQRDVVNAQEGTTDTNEEELTSLYNLAIPDSPFEQTSRASYAWTRRVMR